MSETLEFFRHPDSESNPMDPYGSRVQLTVSINRSYRSNQPFDVRGSIMRDGRPYPGVAWPREEGELNTVVLQPNTAIMGIQVEKDKIKGPIHWELEMVPDGSGGFTATSDQVTKIVGDFVYKVVAMGIFERSQAPRGKIVAFYRTAEGSFKVLPAAQTTDRTDVWFVASLGSAGVSPDLRHRIQLKRVQRDGSVTTASGHIVMPMIPRVPNSNIGNGGLVIDSRRIALDEKIGDAYVAGFESSVGPDLLERFSPDGSHQPIVIHGLSLAGLTSIAIDNVGRSLWLGFSNRLVQIDLNRMQVKRTVNDVSIAVVKDDPSAKGIWAVATVGAPHRRTRLFKYGDQQADDLEVQALEPSMQPLWIAPLNSGRVVLYGIYKRIPELVCVDGAGDIVHESGRLTFSLVDLAANATSGEVWAVVARNERRGFLQKLRPDLERDGPAIDPMSRFQGIDSLMTVNIASATGDIWVAGLKFNPNPPPGTPPTPFGGFGRVDAGFNYTPIRGSHGFISLVRSFG